MTLIDWSLMPTYMQKLIKYIPVTLEIVFVSLLIGLALGILLAICRIYHIPVLDQLSAVYISFIRGTPVNVQLYIIYFGVPALLSGFFDAIGYNINRADSIVFVIITYSLNNAGFLAELVRGAITGVEPGQAEAASSIGMTKAQTFRRIIAPQAARIAIPDFENTMVNLIKNTSLAYMIGVMDIMGAAITLNARYFRQLDGYVACAIIYFVLSAVIEGVFAVIQRRMAAQT